MHKSSPQTRNRFLLLSLHCLIATIAFLFTVSCNSENRVSPPSNMSVAQFDSTPVDFSPESRDLYIEKEESSASINVASTAISGAERITTRTVSITILVVNIEQTTEQIANLATELGGFGVSSYVSGETGSQYAHISFRVPAQEADAALARLRKLATRVSEESSQSQDITEEYVDLESRLANLERTEQHYIRLLDQTRTIKDILAVQEQLDRARGQIENVKGRILYLERTSAMSLITVTVRLASSGEPVIRPGWSFSEIVKDSLRNLTSLGQGLVTSAIWIVIHAPFWLPLITIIYFLIRFVRRRVLNRRTSQTGNNRQGQSGQ